VTLATYVMVAKAQEKILPFLNLFSVAFVHFEPPCAKLSRSMYIYSMIVNKIHLGFLNFSRKD
jgi:hypothetical protein